MSEERSFGNDIANTMTASQTSESPTDSITIVKETTRTELANCDSEPMDREKNENSSSLLDNVLATEIYNLVENSTSELDDLLEEIEELLENFLPGENVFYNGKEYTVKMKERRGGLVLYVMLDGTKINQKDLSRKKLLTIDYIKSLVEDNARYDGKVWKVNDDVKQIYQIKTKKIAPIFCTTKSKQNGKNDNGETSNSSSDNEEVAVVFQGRASAGAPASSNRKSLQAKQKKEEEKAKLKEKRDKEREEKKKIQMEEKRKNLEEKKKLLEDKKKEKDDKKPKNGNIDKFLKKGDSNEGDKLRAPIFNGAQFNENRKESGMKKLEEAWNKRDLEAFNEACQWCEKNLSLKQIESIKKGEWKFGIQRLLDRNKDKNAMKAMKNEQRQKYRQKMLEQRKKLYRPMEIKLKIHFPGDAIEDLLLKTENLELEGAVKVEGGEMMFRCIEITQFLISNCQVLAWDEDITSENLLKSLTSGFEAFKNNSFKILKTLAETILDEVEYHKVAELYVRIKEYPVTEYTITDICRAIIRKDRTLKDPNKYQDKHIQTLNKSENVEQNDVKEDEEEEEEEEEDDDEEDDYDEVDIEKKMKVLKHFEDDTMIWQWEKEKQIDLLEYMMDTALSLPSIRQTYQSKNVPTSVLKTQEDIKIIANKISDISKKLAEIPHFSGNLEDLTRNQSREVAADNKKREQLQKKLEDLVVKLEDLTEKENNDRALEIRKYRGMCIGQDRHFRKYFWFAYSSDAGIWVQDFGTTSYEKWVRKCIDAKIVDFESEDHSKFPNYVDEPLGRDIEVWWRFVDKESLLKLEEKLIKNGKREMGLKKFLHNNMEKIETCFWKRDSKKSVTPIEEEPDGKPCFSGKFETLKIALWTILKELEKNCLTTISDFNGFIKIVQNVENIDDMKKIIIDLVNSIHSRVIIVKYLPQDMFRLEKYSHLIVRRFCDRLMTVNRISGLHLQLAYLQSRIDIRRSLHEKMCNVCRKKKRTEAKMLCNGCEEVFHYDCVNPTITTEEFENGEVIKTWICHRCTKVEKRKKTLEMKEEYGSDGGYSSDESDDEENMRPSRKAKRKAVQAMRDVDSFGFLKPRPIKKRRPIPEVVEVFESLEKKNPRLYKILQSVPSQKRTTRTSSESPNIEDLASIEENLGNYQDAVTIRNDILNFLLSARIYMETHNTRKVEELNSLISEFDL